MYVSQPACTIVWQAAEPKSHKLEHIDKGIVDTAGFRTLAPRLPMPPGCTEDFERPPANSAGAGAGIVSLGRNTLMSKG